jgi:cell division protein FtsL
MHDKLIKAFKQLSFITAHPDADWLKIFIATIALFIYIISYGTFMYIDTNSNIESLGSSIAIKKPQAQPVVQKDDDLIQTIKLFEEKSKKNTELRNSKAVPLLDPISS